MLTYFVKLALELLDGLGNSLIFKPFKGVPGTLRLEQLESVSLFFRGFFCFLSFFDEEFRCFKVIAILKLLTACFFLFTTSLDNYSDSLELSEILLFR